MTLYAKLYSSIVMSSIWSEDSELRVLWITLLALADRDGFIFGSPAGLATFARLPLGLVLAGLEKFKAPDKYSTDLTRSPENEGRRIEEVDGGWRLINYDFYRTLQRAEDRKAQYRESKRKQRGRSTNVPPILKSPLSDTDADPLDIEMSTSLTRQKPGGEFLVEAWNLNCGELRKCRGLTSKRTPLVRRRLGEFPDRERWVAAIKRVSKSDFCLGLVAPKDPEQKPWVATFDWLLKPDTLLRIEEGTYDNRGASRQEVSREQAMKNLEKKNAKAAEAQREAFSGDEFEGGPEGDDLD